MAYGWTSEMKTIIHRAIGTIVLIGCGMWILPANAGDGNLTTPLHIMALSPIADEHDQRLEGTADAPGDCIQILSAPDGVKYPPYNDGRPDARNPIVSGGTAAIGKNTMHTDPQPGIFGHSIAKDRPSGRLFVRVFNAPSPDQATFYGDSQIFSVSGNKTLVVSIEKTDQPVDKRDFDLDGLVNSWERSLGSDETDADTDKDGMTDGEEYGAGTDSLDKNSLLAIRKIQGEGQPEVEDITLGWQSVAGKKYRVDYSSGSLRNGMEWIEVSPTVTADSDWTEYTVSGGGADLNGVFRIRVVE